MIKDRLAKLLEKAALQAQASGVLPPAALPEIALEHPPNPEMGDYASALPMRLARAARMSPLAIAQALAQMIPADEVLEKVSVAPPGFINFTLAPGWLTEQVALIMDAGEDFGNVAVGQGQKVQVEYVSVNPTGPLHVGHGRGAVLGSALARVLAAAGYQVQQEYYVNDAGSQMEAFYSSLYVRYLQALGVEAEMPPNGYMGEYMKDLAHQLMGEMSEQEKNALVAAAAHISDADARALIGEMGLDKVLAWIRGDLSLLGVEFDVWFRERSLFEQGQYVKAMALLRQGGYTAEREGATWFASTALGEDKDNVLVRSSGAPTYFASDVAYHYNKFRERGFDRVINIWGADHQGHVPRMKAVVNALGIDPARLHIIITQLVTLKKGDTVIKVSKRTGELVTLRELIEEVGADACRYFFLARSPDSQMDFDLELAKEQSEANPVYYVQYAHARIAGILRLAEERGLEYSGGDVSLLTSEPELALIRKLLLLPEVVERIARSLEPQPLPHYALELATAFHNFYDRCRVVSPDDDLTRARLKLVKASQLCLGRCLGLMGMTAPDHM